MSFFNVLVCTQNFCLVLICRQLDISLHDMHATSINKFHHDVFVSKILSCLKGSVGVSLHHWGACMVVREQPKRLATCCLQQPDPVWLIVAESEFCNPAPGFMEWMPACPDYGVQPHSAVCHI